MRIVCRSALTLALCVLGVAPAVSAASLLAGAPDRPQPPGPAAARKQPAGPARPAPRRTRSAEHWLALIAEIARVGAISELARSSKGSSADEAINSILLKSSTYLGAEGASGAARVLLVPVPVPYPVPAHGSEPALLPLSPPQYERSQTGSAALTIASLLAGLKATPANYDRSVIPVSRLGGLQVSPADFGHSGIEQQVDKLDYLPQLHVSDPTSSPTDRPLHTVFEESASVSPINTRPPAPPSYASGPESSARGHPLLPTERRARNSIIFPPVDDSQQLLEQFHAQVAQTPSLPPVVIEPLVLDTAEDQVTDVPEAGRDAARPAPQPEPDRCRAECQRAAPAQGPPPPRFERTMMLEGLLTVPRAGYSEPYTLWWDAASGASRMEHHGGSAATYRMVRADGLLHSVHVALDRTGEADVRRCRVLRPRRAPLAERALPVLPDLAPFTFAGYIEVRSAGQGAAPAARVERWVHSEAAAGGAPGEALTYRHELLAARAPDNLTATPLRYAVAVDSSALGANVDSYVHRFFKVHTRHFDAATFHLDVGDACDSIEDTDRIDLVEPLREFALPRRDPAYDEAFDRFKKLYGRRYSDDLEEAVRKNILVQSLRFASSGNRKGASFELETNFLADRLKVELSPLNGAEISPNGGDIAFPYSKVELRRMRGRLPQKFDWRERGGVTPVRNQSLCQACWAFSVVGAVEGALFANTGRLVALSEQSLVDCGHRSGAKGCRPTWPNAAYDYVRDYGLPALDEYNPYIGKVQQCAADRVAPVTRISGHVNVTSKDLLALKVAIRRHGPTVVLIDAKTDSLYTYKKGFYYDAKCKKENSNHAVLAVGWTVHRGETYFILKNSWTAGWGRDGYVYMRGSTNTCGVLRMPSYPVLRRPDVLRVPSSAQAAATPPSPPA